MAGGDVAFRQITPGIERLASSFSLPRHRHLRAYASVVLAGVFEESGYAGRIRASTGDVLVHPAMDCHQNQKVTAGVTLLRLDWPEAAPIQSGLFYLRDVDAIAQAAERDLHEATGLLRRELAAGCADSPGKRDDWPDLLAAALGADAGTEIGVWAAAHGLSPESVSRGFLAAYGVAPSAFRAEQRTRMAWLRVARGAEPLCAIAAATGFADQAHMTRWIHRVTGAPPSTWRRRRNA
jgi:AraC-like DNA-binding protein